MDQGGDPNSNHSTPGRQALFTPEPTEEGANPAPAPMVNNAAQGSYSGQPLSFGTAETGDIIIGGNAGAPTPKMNKKPLIIGGIVLAGVLLITAAILAIVSKPGKHKTDTVAIGEINTAIIFDETAPIPWQPSEGDNYGYINPTDGTWIIEAKYVNAERFYGNYALVQIGSSNNVNETLIIDRAGETIMSFDGDDTNIYYDLQNNFWSVDDDLFNSSMQKVSPKDTKATYIGNGYMLVVGKGKSNDTASTEDEDEDSGSHSDNSDNDGKLYNGARYIASIQGETIYACDQYCVAATVVADNKTYAIVGTWGDDTRIVDLSDGAVIYTTKNKIALQGDIILERGDNTKYLQIQGGQVESISRPKATSAKISDISNYVIESCKDSKYSIKTVGGDTITNCDIDGYFEFSASLYLAYQKAFSKEPLLVVRDDIVQLINISNQRVIKAYDAQDAISFENSPFVFLQDYENGTSKMCNILSSAGADKCVDLGEDIYNVEGYGNYFVTDNLESTRIYNADLQEIEL